MQERLNRLVRKISVEVIEHPTRALVGTTSLAFITVGLLELPNQPTKALAVLGIGLALLGAYKISKEGNNG